MTNLIPCLNKGGAWMSSITHAFIATEVNNISYGCKYIIRDYGDYRTISKVLYKDGAWDLASRVDEYVFWRDPFARQV